LGHYANILMYPSKNYGLNLQLQNFYNHQKNTKIS
jgi:hypothetical protein